MFIENELLIPKTDVVFKCLFRKGNEGITKSFIEEIIQKKINKIDLDKDRVLVKEFEKEKIGILDLRATLDNNTICNIEIQLVDQKNMKQRALFYWSRLYGSQLVMGEDFNALGKTISIIIVDYDIEGLEDEKYVTKWQVIEAEERKKVLTNEFELYIIQIKGALKGAAKEKLMKWIRFLNDPNSLEVKQMAKEEKDIQEAMEKLKEISNDPHIRRMAELREKAILDERSAINGALAKGEERGKKEREKEIAKNMLNKGIDVTTVSEVTGLAKEEIEELK